MRIVDSFRQDRRPPSRQRFTVTFLGQGHRLKPSFPDALSPPPAVASLKRRSLGDWRQHVRLSLYGCGAAFPRRAPRVFDRPENSPYAREPVHQPTTARAELDNAHTSGGSWL